MKMKIPDKTLIGKNAELVEGVYSDDYMNALNNFASVDEVFGKNKEAIAKGENTPVARLIMGTLDKAEYENHLVSIIMTAAKNGEWRAINRGLQHMPGLDEVTRRHFGHVTNYKGQTFLLPSPMYLTYCKEKL